MLNTIRLNRTRRTGGIATALLVMLPFVLVFAYCYRMHLLWKYAEHQLNLRGVKAIPTKPMPESRVPDDWVPCKFPGLEFQLPADLAKSTKRIKGNMIFYHDGSRRVWVSTTEIKEVDSILIAVSRVNPEKKILTLPRLRWTCYQAKSADFRWSMTPRQAAWHTFRLTTGSLMRLDDTGDAETLFRKDLDGLVHFNSDERASFDWQSLELPLGGFIHFTDKREKPDRDWIRAVCRSVRAVDEPEPKASIESR